MSDETQSEVESATEPEVPMVEPAVEPATVEPADAPHPSATAWFETYVMASPYAGADSSGDPFLAGFNAALAHVKSVLPHLSP